MHTKQYLNLSIMSGIHFIAMYFLMYAMVDSASNIHTNINQFYMAGLMTAPMVLLELMFMRSMYQHKMLNAAIATIGIAIFVAFFWSIRTQAAVGDAQFLKSMIPHHAGAILMCEQASLHDAEIHELCRGIIESQQQEIDQMRSILERL